MGRRKRKASSSKRKRSKQVSSDFKIGQRVLVNGYGEGIVIAVEARRGGHYSDLWVRPDENPDQEIGVLYTHELISPA